MTDGAIDQGGGAPPNIEIEVKILDVDFEDLERRLDSIGAERISRERLVTAIYDHPDGRLLAGGAYVRVRSGASGRSQLCYKAPRRDASGFKAMDEIEFEIADFRLACEFLERLGLVRVNILEKDRATFLLGPITFCLDRWPCIPGYLEVEAPTDALVRDGLSRLGIPESRANTMGPDEIFRHYGLDLAAMREVRF